MVSKKEAYIFLLTFCNLRVAAIEELVEAGDVIKKDLEMWQACADLLKSECPFHLSMLERR